MAIEATSRESTSSKIQVEKIARKLGKNRQNTIFLRAPICSGNHTDRVD